MNGEFYNMYFALRHGESRPNVRGIILSDLHNGKKLRHTLTRNGRGQVARSVQAGKDAGLLDADTVIVSSPFSRCAKTAKIARRILGAKRRTVFDDRLRERWFGDWEGKGNIHYQTVWNDDLIDPAHRHANVESTEDVARRVADLIADLEHAYQGKKILLVSHGDALQILQSLLQGKSPAAHRSLPHLGTAEIRRIA